MRRPPPKLRVYETLKEPTGREVCGYLLVRGSVHAHAYALASVMGPSVSIPNLAAGYLLPSVVGALAAT